MALTDLFPMTLASAVAPDATAHAGEHAHAAVSAGPWWVGLIVALPILSTLAIGLQAAVGIKSKLPAWTTVGSLGAAFVLSVLAYLGFSEDHVAYTVTAWDWISVTLADKDAPVFAAQFGFYMDGLSLLWMMFVTGLATLIALYASEYMSHDVGQGYNRFFAAFSLFVFSMACLVMGKNLVMLYLGWEGVGLCSYLLIGYYYAKPSARDAAKKAFIVNRIGDLGLALGIYFTYAHFGTVEYDELLSNPELQRYLAAAASGDFASIPWAAEAIALLLMVGAFGKSAQFPLYVWLPDAMEGPTPVSALIHAATMVTAGLYLISRLFGLFLISEHALPTVAWIGTITALLAATIGMAQFDIKRIMAYSTVSQLGYMFAGLGLLTTTGAVFHVLTHAFFKALLFLCCGAVMHGFAGQLDLRRLSGLWRVPGWRIVTIGMFVGCMNLAGFPFTAGYFSKDMILAEAFVTPGGAMIGWLLLLTAGLTAYYTFRVFFRVFLGPTEFHPGDDAHDHDHAGENSDEHKDHPGELSAHDPGEHGDHHHSGFHPHAPGLAINAVLTVLAIGSILAAGLYFVNKADHGWVGSMIHASSADYTNPYVSHAGDHAADHLADNDHVNDNGHADGHADGHAHGLIGPRGELAEASTLFGQDPHKVMYYVSAVFGFVGIGAAFVLHLAGRRNAAECRMDGIAKRFGPIPRWAEDKWYVDEFYNLVLRMPLLAMSHLFHWFDKLIIDGLLVNGLGRLPKAFASLVRPSQSGQLHGYALGMAGGLVVLMIAVLIALAGTTLGGGG